VTFVGGVVSPNNDRTSPLRSTLFLIDSHGHTTDSEPVQSGDAYQFPHVAPGRYRLQLAHLPPGCGRVVQVTGDQTARAPVDCAIP
jgi:hypothetical protein